MSGFAPPTIWDGRRQQYYYYDARSDQLVYQDGSRVPRPANIPRTAFEARPAPVPDPVHQGHNPGPGGGRSFTYETGNPSDTPQGQAAGRPQAQAASMEGALAELSLDCSSRPIGPQQNLPGQQGSIPRALQPTASAFQQNQPAHNSHGSSSGRPAQAAPVATNLSQRQQGKRPMPVAATVRNGPDGTHIVDVADPHNEVSVSFQVGPSQKLTNPTDYHDGARAQRRLLGTAGEAERLFPSFKKRPQPKNFFSFGKVFMTLWVEPAGESNTKITMMEPGVSLGRHGELVYSKVRRFVVIREGETFCSAVPIATYAGQGVGKPKVTKSEHAIIYTGKAAPTPLPLEEAKSGKFGMRKPSIRVDPDEPDKKLDAMSRVNLAQVHTIQHNLKVRSFGTVNRASLGPLRTLARAVWRNQQGPTGADDESSDEDDDDDGDDTNLQSQAQSIPGASRPSAKTTSGPQQTQSVKPQAGGNAAARAPRPAAQAQPAQAAHDRERTIVAVQTRFKCTREHALVLISNQSQAVSQSGSAVPGPSGTRTTRGTAEQEEESSDEDDDSEDSDD